MKTIEAVLREAGKRQSEEEAVQIWLKDLRDVAYDMEDLFDEISTEHPQRDAGKNHGRIRRMVSKIFSCYSTLPLSIEYSGRINAIKDRIAAVTNEVAEFNFVVQSSWKNREYEDHEPLTTETCSNPGRVIGRDVEKSKILEFLLSERNELALSIVGTGGLGKTALAKLICGDDKVKEKFKVIRWANNSYKKFCLRKIIANILNLKETNETLQSLQNRIHGELEDSFLVVLDDLWDMNPNQWDKLSELLRDKTGGNKVLITTRDQ